MSVRGGMRGAVKDHLRNVRFLARELKDSVHQAERGGGLLQPAAVLTGAIADLSDRTLSRLGAIVLEAVSSEPRRHAGPAPAWPLDHYFGCAGKPAEFARHLYAAAKQLLLARGVGNPSLSEAAFLQAHARARAALALAPPEARALQRHCRTAATVALAIAEARPVAAPLALLDAEAQVFHDANRFVAAVLGLALAVTSNDDGLGPDEPVHASAAVAVTIRYAAIEAALTGDAPRAQLAAIYQELAPHLP